MDAWQCKLPEPRLEGEPEADYRGRLAAWAIETDNVEALRRLLAAGLDPNARADDWGPGPRDGSGRRYGSSPLIWRAVVFGRVECFSLLWKAGAELTDEGCHCALSLVSQPRMLVYLLALEKTDPRGLTPMHGCSWLELAYTLNPEAADALPEALAAMEVAELGLMARGPVPNSRPPAL